MNKETINLFKKMKADYIVYWIKKNGQKMMSKVSDEGLNKIKKDNNFQKIIKIVNIKNNKKPEE